MRLLNTAMHGFQEFFDDDIPNYAILSHRWETDEVSFKDFMKGRRREGAGYAKILRCCSLAASEGFEWVWIDTCCIDKRSSAELSEAINSMYKWYEDAEVCYAYLSDVHPATQGVLFPPASFEPWRNSFEKSVWFTRGWTLQELLAPRVLRFLDHQWQQIGTKFTLAEQVSSVTGIDLPLCNGRRSLKAFSAAQKISWAAKRHTARIEDRAYSLLGILDINMPLLYGEGARAFRRLQEEVIRQTDDESIFAWFLSEGSLVGVLASSPNQFAYSGAVRPLLFESRRPYLITNKGLQMDARVLRFLVNFTGSFLLPLSCTEDGQSPIVLVLQKDEVNDRFFRKDCAGLHSIGSKDHMKSIDRWQRSILEIVL